MQELPRVSIKEHIDGILEPGRVKLPKASKQLFGCSSSGCLTLFVLFVLVVLMRLVFHG